MSHSHVVERIGPTRASVQLVFACAAAAASVALGFAAVSITPVFFAVWPTNAVLVGALALTPRRRLLLHTVVLDVVVTVAKLAMDPFTTERALGFAGSLLAVSAAVAVIRRDPGWIDGNVERIGSWVRFVLAGAIAPFTAAAVAVAVAKVLIGDGPPPWGAVAFHGLVYAAANCVACVLIVPAILRLRPSRLTSGVASAHRTELAATVVLLAVVTAAVMLQPNPAVLFLIPVPLAVLALRHGSVGATLGSLAVVPIVVTATGVGRGPFAASSDDLVVATLWAQVFLTLLMTAVWTTLATLHHQREHSHSGRPMVDDGVEHVCALNRDGTVHDVSPTTLAEQGVPAEEIVGSRWDRAIHPDDRAAATAAFDSAWAGTIATCVLRIRQPDATWRWFDIQMRPGPPDGPVLMVGRGMTDARQREQALERRNQELRIAAETDVLTGLPNRRRLLEAQETIWDAAAAVGEPLSMLMVDVDHFKGYNDRYGHDRGDRALVATSSALRSAVRRPTDLVARYGGEEFVVLLPHTGADGALRVAHRVLDTVRDRAVPHGPGVVTVSVGAATAHPAYGDDPGALFAAADAALYRAKGAGRDRVETAVPDRPDRPGREPV